MAACIAIGCSCPSFAATPSCRGSLIGYSRGCQTCGHLMKEHREMSTIELHVQKEIHRSPMFGPYAPIQVPYDERPNGEAGAECCCKGFQITSLCSILDRLPRTNGTEVLEMLPTVCCLGCGHLLMHHQNKLMQGLGPPTAMSLTLNCSSQLPFPLLQSAIGGCVLLYNHQKDISLVAMAITEHGLSAVVVRKHFPMGEGEGLKESVSDVLGRRKLGDAEVDPSLKAKKQKTEKTRGEEDPTAIRRSVRLAEKRAQKEISDTIKSINTDEYDIEIPFQPESNETITQFMESLETIDSYHTWPLPESINACFAKEATCIQAIAAVWGRDPSSGGDDGLLLSIATTNGKLYICFLSLAAGSVKYFVELSPMTETVQCMCFQKTTQWNLSDIHLCTGGDGGTVCVWHVWFQQEEAARLEHTCIAGDRHTVDSITACCFSHDGSKLVAGTERGDITLYQLESRTTEKSLLKHLQVLHCSRSQVTCLSWSGDGCLLGVGGADDCVQVVSVEETISAKAQSSCSLLKYFSPLHTIKLQHTHILKGHVSFVSGIHFFSHLLASVGLDGQILFWDVQQLHAFDKREIEEVEPKCGFKLGPSNQCDVLPTSIIGIGPSEVFLILQGQKSRATVAHYSSTFHL